MTDVKEGRKDGMGWDEGVTDKVVERKKKEKDSG
jgi:hypothetical protein